MEKLKKFVGSTGTNIGPFTRVMVAAGLVATMTALPSDGAAQTADMESITRMQTSLTSLRAQIDALAGATDENKIEHIRETVRDSQSGQAAPTAETLAQARTLSGQTATLKDRVNTLAAAASSYSSASGDLAPKEVIKSFAKASSNSGSYNYDEIMAVANKAVELQEEAKLQRDEGSSEKYSLVDAYQAVRLQLADYQAQGRWLNDTQASDFEETKETINNAYDNLLERRAEKAYEAETQRIKEEALAGVDESRDSYLSGLGR
jgi:hypothetical protein